MKMKVFSSGSNFVWLVSLIFSFTPCISSQVPAEGSVTTSPEFTMLPAEACLDNMISYLRFSEGSGPVTTDDAYARTLQIDGNAGWVTGRVGSGIAFDGISQHLTMADHADFDWSTAQDFTIELWCRTTGSKDELQVIFGRETSGSTHWWIGTTAGSKPAFYLYDEAGNGGGVVGTDSINDGLWHHIAAVHLWSQGHNLLYIDGELKADSSFVYSSGFNSSSDIQIGCFFSGGANKFFFQGAIDELAVTNMAVEESEIYAHYVKGLHSVDYCGEYSMAPVILSEPDTLAMIGLVYTYQVTAEGLPVPQYELSEAPAGMFINQNTGEITWTPGTVGSYTVIVSAYNTAGSAVQNYALEVREPCMDELFSYLRFNEGAGQQTLDEANLQLIQVGGNASWGEGRSGSGLSFDGITQGLSMAAHPDFNWDQEQDFTLELWFKTNTDKEGLQVIIGRDTPGSTHWWLGLNGSHQAVFYLYDESRNGGGVTGTDPLNDDSWHHLAAVHTGAAGNLLLYIDGELNADTTYVYSDDFHAAVEIQIANLYYQSANNFFFEGQLDEIAVSDRAIPGQEIFEHYLKGINDAGYCDNPALAPVIISEPIVKAYSNTVYTYDVEAVGLPSPGYELSNPPDGMTIDAESGLIQWVPGSSGDFEIEVVAVNTGGEDTQNFTLNVVEACVSGGLSYWNFEESGGTVAKDQLTDREGQLVNNPLRQQGLIGNSISFNGVDQSIIIADDDDYDFPIGSSFSFELWCKPGMGNTGLQVFLGRNETDGVQWWMGLQEDSKLPAVYIFDENRVGSGISASVSIGDGNWHHIAAVYNNEDTELRLYIDGSLNAQTDISFTAGFSSSSILQIAGLYIDGGFDFFYEGELDEVVIYNRAVTEAEISLHNEMGRLGYGYCFSEGSLGIESRNHQNVLKYTIYPMPAQDKLFIDLESDLARITRVQLISTLGITAYEKTENEGDLIEVDVTELARGVYILRLISEETVLVQEAVIIN